MTNTIDACRFCAIARGESLYGAADEIVDGDVGHFAIPSIGAFIEGWTLVVPRQHVLSLCDKYGTSEFSAFVAKTVSRVRAVYGPVIVFEHGSRFSGSQTSCGTDHAHLHIVPKQIALSDVAFTSDLTPWISVASSAIKSIVGDEEYLFFSDAPEGEDFIGYVHRLEKPVSQFFRRLLATNLGITELGDYKRHPLLHKAEQTQARLMSAF